MIDPDRLRKEFARRHGREPRLFSAPGRVNLIGEHTDYNDGFVLPVAIDRTTVVAIAARDDRCVMIHSENEDETLQFDLDGPAVKRRGQWLDYVEGVARVLESKGHRLTGATMVVASDVPDGAGLSSSAALEISTGLALSVVSGIDVDRVQLALSAQQAEHEYVGARVGIMDQFIAALGKAGHALLIDCRTLEANAIPMAVEGVDLVICDTRVKHTLAASEYNARRAECERGVELLQRELPGITALRDVSAEQFAALETGLPEPVRSRCRHVVLENARTLAAASALCEGDLETVCMLMAESHRSLRDDYEVSCEELDTLVDIAGRVPGVVGARMTGGGFGGCTVNLVRRRSRDLFLEQVTRQYYRARQLEPAVYVTRASAGAHEIS